MLINCERNLKSERVTNKSEKNSATRIATIAIILTSIYCVITSLLCKLKI